MREKKYPFSKGAFGKGVYHNAEIGRLMGMGLTFYKNFVNALTLTADYAYGFATAIYTSTSGIPTINANGYSATTANADVLKYAISGNRTAAQETFICKFMPDSSFANDGINRFICDTGNSGVSTVDGALLKTTTGTVIFHSPESSRGYSGVTNILGNVSYIVSGLFFGNTGNPNARLYLNSVLESTQNSDMISSPDFGSFFYLGTKGTGVNQLNGSIAWVKIFNRPLTASEIATLQ